MIQYINDLDFAIGVILMVVILVVLWLMWGPPIPIITTVPIAYYLWGHLLPGALYHPFSPPTYVISTLVTSLSKGIFGGLAPISANMIFYFMLFDSGVSTWKPYVINIHCGKHTDEQIDVDPWGQLQIIKDIEFIRHEMSGACTGVCAGGRNWLPISTQGIMQGCDIVRTGIEDQYWLWPHRDEISTSASQTTELVVTIAKTLGRGIATPAEAREILGMKLT